MDVIIAALEAAARAALRSHLTRSRLAGDARLESADRPSRLAERLAERPAAHEREHGPDDTLIVTGAGLPAASEFVRIALARGVPVLIWPSAPGTVGPRRALTLREREILALVAAGVSNKGIARALQISPNTVKFHLTALFAKLAVTTRAEAIAAAARTGELSL